MKTTLGRRWLSLILTLAMCLALAPAAWAAEGDADPPAAPEVTSITASIPSSTMSLLEGDSVSLPTLTVMDQNGNRIESGYTAQWRLEDSSTTVIAVDDANKSVQALNAGTARAVCRVEYRSNGATRTASVTLTVKVAARMGKVNFDITGPLIMDPGRDSVIRVTTDPTGETVTWTYTPATGSSSKAVLVPRSSAGPNHTITAVEPGEGRLTATIGSEEGNTQSRWIAVEVSGLVLSSEDQSMTLLEDEVKSLPIPTAYGNAKNGRVTWQSADPTVAQVTGNSLAGRGPGTTTVTASVGGNYLVSFTATVTANTATTITHKMTTSERLEFNRISGKINSEQAGGKLSHITGLYVSPDQGTLYYKYASPDEPNAGVAQRGSYYLAPYSGQESLNDITFIPNPTYSGKQATISYTVVTTTNQTYSCRILIDMTQDQRAVIDLSTRGTEPVYLSGVLFDRQCQQRTGSGLEYVIFSLPPSNKGTLYTGYTSANNYGGLVSSSTMYRLAQLDSIAFVPAPGTADTTVAVYYTVRSSGSSTGTYNGQVNIKILRDNAAGDSEVEYTISRGATKIFDDGDFTSFTGLDLNHIRFNSLPSSQQGVLYYDYRSSSNKGALARTDISFYAGTRTPRLDRVAFVAAEDYNGTVEIPFTGWDVEGNRFSGCVTIIVRDGGGYGDIRYDCAPGRTVKFTEKDFNDLSRDLTDRSLNYIVLQNLPDRNSEGSVYHNNSRISSTGTRYYYGSSSNRIRNLSFHASGSFSGTAEIPFTATVSGGGTFDGVISIDASGGGSGDTTITYYTEYDSAAVFDRDDFNEVSLDETGYSISSVKFSVPSASRGDLYRNYRSSSSKGSRITSSSTSISSSALDQVAFVPADGYVGTVYIDYTATSSSSKETFTGTVEIDVGRPTAAVTVRYSTRTAPVDFNGSDFRRSGYTLRSVKFSSLPTSNEGTLYYQYTSAGKYTRLASTSTSYNLSGSNLISDLTFVPRSGFSGTVVLPYIGTNSNSKTFYGEVVIDVTAPASSANRFNDLGGCTDQQRTAVSYIYDAGITVGISSTEYGPSLSIRRGDFAMMVYNAFKFSSSGSSWVFNDVPPYEYYAQAVNALYDRGVVSGVGNGDFAPSASVTREDAICMVQRAMRASGMSASDGSTSALSRYGDWSSVSGYAQGAMAMAVQRGYLPITGSYLDPQRPLTRIEMAEILHRVLTYSY